MFTFSYNIWNENQDKKIKSKRASYNIFWSEKEAWVKSYVCPKANYPNGLFFRSSKVHASLSCQRMQYCIMQVFAFFCNGGRSSDQTWFCTPRGLLTHFNVMICFPTADYVYTNIDVQLPLNSSIKPCCFVVNERYRQKVDEIRNATRRTEVKNPIFTFLFKTKKFRCSLFFVEHKIYSFQYYERQIQPALHCKRMKKSLSYWKFL